METTDKKRDELKELYYEIYMDRPDYGAGTYEGAARMICSDFFKQIHVIDVGCGRNLFKKTLEKMYQDKHTFSCIVTGTDLASPYADVICPAHRMPFLDKEFNVLTCFETLEHLQPDEIDSVLKEFGRVTSQMMILTISNSSSIYRKAMSGEEVELHLTRQNFTWWTNKFLEIFPGSLVSDRTIYRMEDYKTIEERYFIIKF